MVVGAAIPESTIGLPVPTVEPFGDLSVPHLVVRVRAVVNGVGLTATDRGIQSADHLVILLEGVVVAPLDQAPLPALHPVSLGERALDRSYLFAAPDPCVEQVVRELAPGGSKRGVHPNGVAQSRYGRAKVPARPERDYVSVLKESKRLE